MREVAKSPGRFGRFRDAEADKAGLIEEAIRWSTPVQHLMRSAREDVELGGQTIRAGDWLMLNYVSANREEAVFADPFAFEPDRAKHQQIDRTSVASGKRVSGRVDLGGRRIIKKQKKIT